MAKKSFHKAKFGAELGNALFYYINFTLRKLDCSPEYLTHFLISISRNLINISRGYPHSLGFLMSVSILYYFLFTH